jgi:Cu/Ag efflux pump CusA
LTSIVRWSLSFPHLVVALATALLVLGATQLRNAPVDVLPEFNPPAVEIQTEALGLSASEVEQFITVPMESLLLAGVAWVDTIRSESVPGLSSIVLEFEPGTDLMRARQMVQERLTQAHSLPRVSKPPQMIQPLSSTSRVLMVGLSSADVSLIDMSVLARWTIRPRLMGVAGVANVAIWGQRERQLQVLVDPQRLNEAGITLDQVISTAGNALWVSPLSFLEASTPGSGGFIDTPNQRLGIRHVLPISAPEDLEQVPVEGTSVRLGQVTDVVEQHQPLIGDAVTDRGPALLLVVEKLPGANTLQVTRDLEAALEAMRPGLEGIEVDSTVYRPAGFVETAVDNVLLVGLLALLLVGLTAFLFLYSWRGAVISLLAVLVSLATAALVIAVTGSTINALVVCGLVGALAIIVVDALEQVERVIKLRAAPGAGDSELAAATVLQATLESRVPLLFAMLIVLLATVPLLVIEGALGDVARPLAISFAVAVVTSMLVALTLTPALAVLFLRGRASARRDANLVQAIRRRYQSGVAPLVRRPAPVVVGAVLVALVGVVALSQLSLALVPAFRERDLLISVEGAPGTSQPAMSRVTSQIGRELRTIPGVRNVGAHIGRAIMSDQVVGISSGQLWVSLDDSADHDATVRAVEAVVGGYPGLRAEVHTYLNDRAAAAEPDPIQPVHVRIFGPDLPILQATAQDVVDAISGIEGLVEPRIESQTEETTLEVEVDLAAAQGHGVKPGDVRRAAAALLSGIEVGSLFEDQKVFEVVVWGVPQVRHSLSSVRELRIDTPGGQQIRLDEVADVRFAPTPTSIAREGISRRIEVIAGVAGRDVGAVLDDVRERLAQVEFPLEYHPELVVLPEEDAGRVQRVAGFTIAAVIGMLLLLQAAFGGWRLAAVSLLLVPVALAGGVVAALIDGGTISLGSIAGFLGVLGLAVRGAIGLVDELRRVESGGMPLDAQDVSRAAGARLRPALMTATATALALLPIVVLGDRPGLELPRAAAIVTLGGIVTTLLVNLFVLPALYLHARPEPEAAPAEIAASPPSQPGIAGAR